MVGRREGSGEAFVGKVSEFLSHPALGVCGKKCRRHEMFIDEKRSWISRSPELSEMLGISLNSGENKMGVRASYKHFAATRLFFRQTPRVHYSQTRYLVQASELSGPQN